MTTPCKIIGMYIVEVWIEHPVRSLDQTYSYLSNVEILQGCRVSVPFGVKQLTGFSESCTYTEETEEQIKQRFGFSLKFISNIIDEQPLINEELHDLALWMKDQTLSTTISCFQAMLPSIVKPLGKDKHRVKEKWVKLSDEEVNLTPKQLQAYLYVQQNGKVKYSTLREMFKTIPHTLVEKNAFILFEEERDAKPIENEVIAAPFALLDSQNKAMHEITDTEDAVYLLHGVTGSGKTEVYLQLAMECLKQGKQVLILVPEIALTPQMIERVSSRFHNALAIYHSGLNAQEKYEQWKLVKNNQARIVVGTRSAVFLPFDQLGLIVMDEEHDASYKQDVQPCYHARDIVIQRGKYHHCKVILGSATPSLDSYARALRHVYHLVEIKERINHCFADITLVDMKRAMMHGESFILSDTLKEKMQKQLALHKQIILLLNRRGFHSQLRCKSCQEVIRCPHCDIAMSYHRDIGKMKCHTCGYEMYVPRICPHCGSGDGFTTFGFGTERLEEEVHQMFPGVKTLRMDADTTSRKNAHAKILKAFENQEAEILLGTQMIAKGLDFPNVTLVGIINGDEGLNRTDFRSAEATFDLLMQASGRSGRKDTNGEVVIQVIDPSHYVVQCTKEQNYEKFFMHEMQFRKAGQYPPYTYLIAITVSSTQQNKVDHTSLLLMHHLQGNFKVIGIISLLKKKDLYRQRILLKGKNLDEMRKQVKNVLTDTEMDINTIHIDVNPLTLD